MVQFYAVAYRAVNRSSSIRYLRRIHEQLEIDQRGATQPDTNTPFSSTSDACKRLLRYHCLDEPVLSEKDLEKADEIFEATAKHLLDKNAQMLNKYSYLICKESMVSEAVAVQKCITAAPSVLVINVGCALRTSRDFLSNCFSVKCRLRN